MSAIRPAGAGREAHAIGFMRPDASPRSALIIVADLAPPADWPLIAPGDRSAVSRNLGHALGWTCEVRRTDVVLLNPLGEGIVKCPLPSLSVDWLSHVRHDGSCSVFLVPSENDDDVAEVAVEGAAATGSLTAATVRTAVADDYGQVTPPGRNAPCPCGSGRKYKQCHG